MNDLQIHDSAFIDEGGHIASGTYIWHFCHVMEGAYIGDNCSLGQNVFVGRNVSIGDGTRIQNNVSVFEGVSIDSGVFLGPSCVFTNDLNPRAGIDRPTVETHVGFGSTIGANATIICGNDIGKHSFIAAGTVVTKTVPDFALLIGNPGKVTGWMCVCGEKLKLQSRTVEKILHCEKCPETYLFSDGVLKHID